MDKKVKIIFERESSIYYVAIILVIIGLNFASFYFNEFRFALVFISFVAILASTIEHFNRPTKDMIIKRKEYGHKN